MQFKGFDATVIVKSLMANGATHQDIMNIIVLNYERGPSIVTKVKKSNDKARMDDGSLKIAIELINKFSLKAKVGKSASARTTTRVAACFPDASLKYSLYRKSFPIKPKTRYEKFLLSQVLPAVLPMRPVDINSKDKGHYSISQEVLDGIFSDCIKMAIRLSNKLSPKDFGRLSAEEQHNRCEDFAVMATEGSPLSDRKRFTILLSVELLSYGNDGVTFADTKTSTASITF